MLRKTFRSNRQVEWFNKVGSIIVCLVRLTKKLPGKFRHRPCCGDGARCVECPHDSVNIYCTIRLQRHVPSVSLHSRTAKENK